MSGLTTGRRSNTLVHYDIMDCTWTRRTITQLRSDLAFIEDLEKRLEGVVSTRIAKGMKRDFNSRVWVRHSEVVRIRQLAGSKISTKKVKNRRMRMVTVRQYLKAARESLELEMGQIVANKLEGRRTFEEADRLWHQRQLGTYLARP